MDGWQKVGLDTLNQGAALELFDHEWKRILDNINDVNTTAKKTREFTLKVKITPDERREIGAIEVSATSKLEPYKSLESSCAFKRDDGEMEAYESSAIQPELKFENQDNVSELRGGR